MTHALWTELLMDDPELLTKLNRYWRDAYVRAMPALQYCPAPGCKMAIKLLVDPQSSPVTLICSCGHSFCELIVSSGDLNLETSGSKCAQPSHRPVRCEVVEQWLNREGMLLSLLSLHSGSEDEPDKLWMLSHTKPCPKCKAPIEKNLGCLHMLLLLQYKIILAVVCRTCPCGHHFCWLCLQPFVNHSSYYQCNKYDPAVIKVRTVGQTQLKDWP